MNYPTNIYCMTTSKHSLRIKIMHISILVLFALTINVFRLQVVADDNPPERLSYQGFLVDANGVALGNSAPKNYDVIFRIYDAQSSGNRLWAEQQTLTVDKGYFSVLLGEGAQVGSEPHAALSTLFTGSTASDRFVEITVKGIGAGGGDSTIAPRLRLLTSPYAYLARRAVQAGSLINSTNGEVVSISGSTVTVSGTMTADSLKADGQAYVTVKELGGGMNPCINFDGSDWMMYRRSENSYNFYIDSNEKFRITSSNVVVTASGGITGPGTIPLGGIIMWSGSTVPSGWALCNGSVVNNITTPDLRGRFILGSGQGTGLTDRQLKQTGGVEKHALSTSELPAHNHAVTDPGHGHNFTFHEATGDGYHGGAIQVTDRSPKSLGASEIKNNTTGISIQNTGSGTAHENMPPYYVLAFIMRVQ